MSIHEQFGEAELAGGSILRPAVASVFRYRRLLLGVVGVVLLVTALVTLFTPRTYLSEMKLVVRNARPEYLLTPERTTGQVVPSEVTEERMNSEMEVLRSRDVADAVVDPAWASKPEEQRSAVERKSHETAVTQYYKRLTVEALRKSNVIQVSYAGSSPTVATATVERLLSAFLSKQHEMEHASGASTFFASEAARLQRELDAAQSALAAYQQGRSIVSPVSRETALEQQIDGLDQAIRLAQVEETEAAERVSSDRRQLAALPTRQPTQQRSIPNTQAVEQLTAVLITYQNKRTELMTRYQPTDRLIAEVDQQIAQTRAALVEARATNGEESTTDVNPVSEQVRGQFASSTTDVAALRGKLGDLTVQRDRLRQQLSSVEGSAAEFTVLENRVAELETNYQLYTQKKNETAIADAMDRHQLVNVAVAERPTYAEKLYRPQVWVNLALGVLTALFLGGCAVFVAEMGRDTIATAAELETLQGTKVLATVPFDGSEGYRRPVGSNGPPDSSGSGGGSLRRARPVAVTGLAVAGGRGVRLPDTPAWQRASTDKTGMWPRKRLVPSTPLASSVSTLPPAPVGYEELATARARSRDVQPRDPVAYPRYPRRDPRAAQPVYHIEAEPFERGVPLPAPAPRRASIVAMQPPTAGETI